MKCQQCSDSIPPGEEHDHNGQMLCDDCFMDAMSPKTACNPWAVYTATRLGGQEEELSRLQADILEMVRQKGRVPLEEVLASTGLDQEGLKREMLTLRHMSLVSFELQPDKSIMLKFCG